MTERNVGRPWTAEEDALLKHSVEIYGDADNWIKVAECVPGRTNKACRKRWLHSLSPDIKKTAWTSTEDQKLLELYRSIGPRWSAIARQIPGRTDDACSKRYREALDPNLKKDEWTPDEDETLREVYSRIGGKWGQVGQELKRSSLACRNRWRHLERKRTSQHINKHTPTAGHSCELVNPEPIPAVLVESEYSSPSSEPRLPPVMWPYFPDEAYPFLQSDEIPPKHLSPEPYQPPPLDELHIRTPPVISSFSSLENALSDPPRISRPLPPITTIYEDPFYNSPLTVSSFTPSSQTMDMMAVDSMLLNDEYQSQQSYSGADASQCSQNRQTQSFFTDDVPPTVNSEFCADSSQATGYRDGSQPPPNSPWASPFPPDINFLRPAMSPFTNTPTGSTRDDLPTSPGSTPRDLFSPASFGSPRPLSLTSSPLASSLELPINDKTPSSLNGPTGSLLFSLPLQPQQLDANFNRKKKKTVVPVRKIVTDPRQHRLSAQLRLSKDPNVLPYACGYEQCWPPSAEKSSSCYATSRELNEHSRQIHGKEPLSEKPFRCGLQGCGKSWKSPNGLQYHLQISTAHYRKALSSTLSKASTPESSDPSPAPDAEDADSSDNEGSGKQPKRTFVCSHSGCGKTYRQMSGLRYHRKHGHPQHMPVQLDVVPPALARELPMKAKKMRRKDSLGTTAR